MTNSEANKVLASRIRHAVYAVLLIVLDQLTKLWVRRELTDKDISLIPGVFKFTFVKNTGAVWGMGSGKAGSVIFLTVVTLIILVGIIYIYLKFPSDKKYYPLQVILMFIIAGAIGNLIDRIFLGYVTDFLYFELINFPVFNVADCYITVSCFVIIFLVLTVYKDEEFDFLSLKGPKNKKNKEE